ncbi:MAG: MoxR family ATPase [Planctomycetes bacterium]|nr:MoxR family ATPase [Planctomycetota bacterium]MCH9034844.1 MoxR family ATPase [Planctomycetota bacterium]
MSSEPQNPGTPAPQANDVEMAEKLIQTYDRIREQLGLVIVGQEGVLEEMLIALFCNGHCILEGVPGLAKTLMVSTLSKLVSLSFSRIQFTPDLMPSDITGTEVIEEDRGTGSRSLRFVKGPIFANVVLADEINRTPPKTQSALLEAMQEHQVTAAGFPHKLPRPFFVLATQNPIEQEGTYPLPEAQLDRFMFKTLVDYPSEEEEFRIVKMTTASEEVSLKRTLTAHEVIELQNIVRRVPCADQVIRYAMRLVRATRVDKGDVETFVKDYVAWGAGPRASQNLVLAGKARALLHGRFHVSADDIRAVAYPVLRHRVLLSFNAEAEGITSDAIIHRLIESIASDSPGAMDDAMTKRVFAGESSDP